MFWNTSPKKQQEQDTLSRNITISGTITNSPFNLGNAGRDLIINQSGNLESSQQITSTEVVKQLEILETAVNATELSQSQKEELLDYLSPAKREAAKKNGSKGLIGENLKSLSEMLKTIDNSTESGKNLWQTSQDVFKAILPWLGVAGNFFGM
jgi:hypothetical protein